MLLDEIRNAQDGNQDAMMTIIRRFNPLLRKYGRKLGYEDATDDLTVELIEQIKEFQISKLRSTSEGAIVNYIATTIYRDYSRILKSIIEEHPKSVSLEDMTPSQKNKLFFDNAAYDEQPLSLYIPKGILTDTEQAILIAIYEEGKSIAEIAKQQNVSRQNINQIKKKAITKLKTALM
mgnify:FL=1|jgi:RNA polymerase sigma factor, sigma-70 family